MMAKFVLQLQVIVIVLTFFLIVIDHYVCGASEHLRIYRGDHDTFEINPNRTSCTARNAKCTFPDTDSGCSQCTCVGQYKTYLRYFDKCVRDNELLYLPDKPNSLMIKEFQITPTVCITYDQSDNIAAVKCNSSDPSQRWIWTQYSQILHVETSKCIQQGQEYGGKNDTWHLDLEKCNVSETKQIWNYHTKFIRRNVYYPPGQLNYVYIANIEDTILAKLNHPTFWERHQLMALHLDKMCYLQFTNPAMVVLDTKCQSRGEQQIANFQTTEKCLVLWNHLKFGEKNWKHVEFTTDIFSISRRSSGIFLEWDFTRAPRSKWFNRIIKLDLDCTAAGTKCVLIKLKNSSIHCPTTASSTVLSSEAGRLKSSTSAASSNNTSNTSHASSTKSPTSSKEQQEGKSSSVVGIVVGLLVAILALCGLILGFFCYKRRSRLDRTSSNVEINGKGKLSGDTLNPIYSSEDNKNPSLPNDGGIYQEADGNANAASQECDLYEPGGDHEYDYAKVEQKNKPAPPSEELEYDYAKTDDIKSAVQRAPVRGNAYQDTVIKNKNTATDANQDKETGNDAGPLYQTLEDETAPVYQTLESE